MICGGTCIIAIIFLMAPAIEAPIISSLMYNLKQLLKNISEMSFQKFKSLLAIKAAAGKFLDSS